MARCDTCGNEYERTLDCAKQQGVRGVETHVAHAGGG